MFGIFKSASTIALEQEVESLKAAIANLEIQLDSAWRAKKNYEIVEVKNVELEKKILDLVSSEDQLNIMVAELRREIARINVEHSDALLASNANAISDEGDLRLEIEAMRSDYEEITKDRATIIADRQRLWEEYQKLSASRDEYRKRSEELSSSLGEAVEVRQDLEKLVENLKSKNRAVDQLTQKIDDLQRENQLILLQIHETRDIVKQVENQNEILVNENRSLSARWARVLKRYPDYTDVGGIEVVKVDSLALVPQVIWRVSDYFQDQVSLSSFYFKTVFKEGNPGIGIVKSLEEEANSVVLIPGLLQSSAEQVQIFRNFSVSDWERIKSTVMILEQYLTNKNSDSVSTGLDIGFWRSSLLQMIGLIKSLPAIFRFERLKLKRELRNTDYEHLWITLEGVQYGKQKNSAMEFRVGASLVQQGSFSRFPKIEFPLVNGKDKPFESWFAESYDDFGAKYELRFSLDKKVFDYATFAKLSLEDQSLLQNVIFNIPSILSRLFIEKVSINRAWATWIDFAKETSLVLQLQLQALKVGKNLEKAPESNSSTQSVSNENKKNRGSRSSMSVVVSKAKQKKTEPQSLVRKKTLAKKRTEPF